MHSKNIKNTWEKCVKAKIYNWEKDIWKCIHLIRKIQVNRAVKKNFYTNSNLKWMYHNSASKVEKFIKISDNLLVIKKIYIQFICIEENN